MSNPAYEKKSRQLGMNASTASHRLVKDLLWNFIVQSGQDKCCKCGAAMSRENFSIEHIEPWLDSEDPVRKFFSIDNIGYSHLSCNIGDARRPNRTTPAEKEAKRVADNEIKRLKERAQYTPERRRLKYATTGH